MGLSFPLPDEFLLMKILTKCLYFDQKSKEGSTGVIKKKYKLAGINNDILTETTQVYRFFVGTSEEASCQKELTLAIYPNDWEEIDDSHKSTIGSIAGYYDVKNIDVIGRTELLEKMRDISNGFKYVANLKYEAFGKLKSIALQLDRAHKPISKTKVPHILNALIKKNDEVERIMQKLGLI